MSASQQARYGASGSGHARNPSSSGQQQQYRPSGGYNYDASQSTAASSAAPSATGSPAVASRNQDLMSDDGDVAMEDADPYNRLKYPTRPHGGHGHGHAARPSGQYLSEESAAARRYSPMNAFSPTTPYAASPQQQAGPAAAYNAYTPQSLSARQSPTRAPPFSSPSLHYYPSSCTSRARSSQGIVG